MYLICGIGKEYCRRFCIPSLHLQLEIFEGSFLSEDGNCLDYLSADLLSLVQDRLKDCNFIKKRLQHRYFPVKFAKCWRTPFFKEHLHWMLLHIFPWINLDTVFSHLNLCSRLISDLSWCFGKSRGILH